MEGDWASASNKPYTVGVPSWAVLPPWGHATREVEDIVGEMADYYAEQEIMESVYKQREKFLKKQPYHIRYTEDVLNSTNWVTGEGQILAVTQMDKDHIRNVLQFLYKRKDRYWLNCRNGKLIEQFENGEDFFQRVIRVSTLWTELIRVLTEDGALGFNFEILREGR